MNTNKSIDKNRDKTDSSLRIERKTTDEKISSSVADTEKATDEKIASDRAATDRMISRDRDDSDINQKLERVLPLSSEQFQNDEQRLIERSNIDSAIKSEREKLDTAIDRERGKRDALVEQFIKKERDETDKDLAQERRYADKELESIGGLLEIEREGHGQAKSALSINEELLAIASHDLRNPIGNVVLGANHILQNFDSLLASGDLKRWVELMQRNSWEALNLIHDLIDSERIAIGKFELKISSVDATDLVNQSVDAFSALAAKHEISLTGIHSQKHIHLKCDPARMKQVFSNVLSNAIKFTPKGGSIEFEVKEINSEVQFSISDTGAGIAQSDVSKIFKKFSQLGKKGRSGLGFGLYISKTIVELHHGSIHVDSVVGKGSSFLIRIPA